MIVALGHAEAFVRSSAKRPSLLDLIGVEIDVRVEIADHDVPGLAGYASELRNASIASIASGSFSSGA